MAEGSVRAILWKHLHARAGPLPDVDGPDPRTLDANALVPAGPFTRALDAVADRDGVEALRRIGRDYPMLWGRTFSTLVQHTAGRPRAMLGLLVQEVLPYLRGHPLAARVERRRGPTLALRLQGDLHPAYMRGMLEGFFLLARCEGVPRHEGDGLWTVRIRVDPTARLQHAAHLAATLRIPYLATALAATLVGLAVAGGTGLVQAAVILLGVVSAQAAVNAAPDLLERPGPLEPRQPRPWLLAQVTGSSIVAAAAGAWLVRQQPLLMWFLAAGALLAISYPVIRRWGIGPLATAIAHGPLLTTAVAAAARPDAPVASALAAAPAGLPVGLAAAALLVLGDMADRPLDEAGGARTLAVRLPGGAQVAAFTIPLVAALGTALVVLWPTQILGIVSLGALTVAAGILVRHVIQNAKDPAGLAPARVATLLLHVGITGTLIGGFL